MTRSPNSYNNCYKYHLVIDGKEEYLRTIGCVANKLEVSLSTIRNYLKDRTKKLRKYRDNDIQITQCKKPIFERVLINYE
jgi:predicted transcriptional regulator